jgi:PTS system nitrogen regulatory IIA component
VPEIEQQIDGAPAADAPDPMAEALPTERVHCGVEARSKKHALEIACELLALPEGELIPSDLFCSLIQRERLGCTGLGYGVALPHGRSHVVDQPRAVLMQLREAVDYDAPDGAPVDLVLAVLVPKDAQPGEMEMLATAAKRLQNTTIRAALRRANDPGGLRAAMLTKAT